MSTPKSTASLSVRIDPDIFEQLKKYAEENRGVTQAMVVEKLLEYFHSQNEEQKKAIISGGSGDSLKLLSKAIQLVEWGDHAYTKGFWLWSIETYGELYKISSGIPSLRRMAQFKLGSSWMDLALELRRQGFISDSRIERGPHIDAAIDSLWIAIGYHRLFNQSLEEAKSESHPTTIYNEACALTQIAQFFVEKSLDDEHLDHIRQTVIEESFAAKEIVPTPLPQNQELSSGPVVDGILTLAQNRLNRVKARFTGDSEGMPLAETQWLIEYSERDPDLAFLRREKAKDFDDWLSRRKSKVSILDAFKALRRRVPKEVEEITKADVDRFEF